MLVERGNIITIRVAIIVVMRPATAGRRELALLASVAIIVGA
ncbi:MAG: hypothetical protein ACI8U4_001892 [Natronomonas sp.]|jgi:hypothetical protein